VASRESALRIVLVGSAVAAGVALLGRLSLWQWRRGRTTGSLMNYTYAVEWALLAVVLVGGLLVLRRRGRRAGDDDDASRDVAGNVIGPPLRPGEQLGEVTAARVARWFRRATPRTQRCRR
jgi:cytochrome oxidase assembly protein ShyY1